MKDYIKITGYIKNHQNFKILFWSWDSKKQIFTIFPEIFYEKSGNIENRNFYGNRNFRKSQPVGLVTASETAW